MDRTPFASPPRGSWSARTPTVLAVIAGVAALSFASAVLIPVALAVLLAFVLAPPVRRLERLRVPRVAAVVLVVAVFLSLVFGVGWLVQGQAVQLAADLPRYKSTIAAKVAALRGSSTGAIDKATATIKEIGREIAKTPPPAPSSPPAPPAPPSPGDEPTANSTPPSEEPTPVRVVDTTTSPIESARELLGPVFSKLATGAIVVVFAVFILVQREELRDRLVRLLGRDAMHQTTPALDDAARRVSRYLALQLGVNTVVGVLIGAGLLALNVPGALLWGALTVMLRFIPYVGTWVGAAFPILVSLAVSPGWEQPLMVAGWIAVVEVGCSQFIEPLLFGSGTGLSPLAVLASALFWGWLWGPVGLLLSTPIAVCLAVMGKHFPRMGFLHVLLSDKVALAPEARLYQRLLAGDAEESARIVGEFRQKQPELVDAYQQLVMPALLMAETARHGGELDDEQERSVREIAATLVDDIGPSEPTAGRAAVLCVAVRDAADTLAARMLAQVLWLKGVEAQVLPHEMLTGELLELVAERRPAVVCVCALPPSASMHTRVVCKRLRARFPSLPVLACLWTGEERPDAARAALGEGAAEHVATTLAQAVSTVTALHAPMARPIGPAGTIRPIPA